MVLPKTLHLALLLPIYLFDATRRNCFGETPNRFCISATVITPLPSNKECDRDSFLPALNSVHPCLTSTFEKKADDKPIFLDALVEKAKSELFTSVCRKANLLDNIPVGILSTLQNQRQTLLKSQCTMLYLLQIQTTTRIKQHQNYPSRKWLPRQYYSCRYAQGYYQIQCAQERRSQKVTSLLKTSLGR